TAQARAPVREADAVSRRGLAGNRDVAISNDARAVEPDEARDAKHDGARAAGLNRSAVASGPTVVQIGHLNDHAAAAAASEAPVTFRPRKREVARAEFPHRALDQICCAVG